MKQRIIATILLLVTVLATFAGCANYAFAEKESFADYAKVDYDALLKALHTIEIEEEDFGFSAEDDDRQAIVVDEIYNTLLTALSGNADNKQKNGTINSTRDMVEYYYYCTYEANGKTYEYGHKMTTTTNTLTTSSSTDAEKDLKKAILETLIEFGYTFNEDEAYSIKTTLTNEKIVSTDEIVVSYTLKTTDGENVTYKDYANYTIKAGDELFDEIITNNDKAVLIGVYNNNESVVIGNNEYKNVSISHIVEKNPEAITVEQTTEDEQDVTAYVGGVKTTVTIPEDATVTYHVYPVSYVLAPVVDANLIVRYVLGDDISTSDSDLTVLGSEEYTVTVGEETLTVKALVDKLAAEYKNNAEHYESLDYVKEAKNALVEERVKAKNQAIKDAITALSNATKKDSDNNTVKVSTAILEHYNANKAEEDKAADIYEVFAELYEADGKIKFSKLLDGGILTLYTYKNGSDVSAVSLVNDINAEYETDVNTAYESYQKDLDSTKAGNEIDVVDKRERYENAVAQAQNSAVNAIIENLLACKNGETSVQDAIVAQYETSVYNTEFTSYDLVKNILLTSSSTSSTLSFIEDLSDYVYGTSNVDDEERETFSSILTDLVAEFGKTASDYENVESVKDAKLAVEEANLAAEFYLTVAKYASELKNFKNGDVNAFTKLAEVYIANHEDTTFVIKDAKTNEKLASSYASTVLQLILDDEANVEAYKAAVTGEFTNTTDKTPAGKTALEEFEKALAANAQSKVVADAEEAYADAQTAAHEAAVDALIAKLLSGVHTNDEGENEKLSVVLAERYVENTINSKISTYNTNVQNKLAKAIYEIINDDAIVTVDTTNVNYPAKLIKEFYTVLEEGYKYSYYTGTSSITTTGTPAVGVSAEDRAKYNHWVAIYDEANAAMTSAETAISNAITAYVTALVTIYDMEAIVAGRSSEDTDTTYFDENNALAALAKEYYEANARYNDANKANTKAKNDLTKAQKALTEAEKLLETAKNEKIDTTEGLFEGIATKIANVQDAKKEVKNAKDAVEAADIAVNGTKKNPEGTKKALEDATEALADAKKNLVDAFATDGLDTKFVESEKDYSTKKSAYSSANTTYTDKSTVYDTYYSSYKTTYEEKEQIVVEAGKNATEEQIKARDDAKEKMEKTLKEYTEAVDSFLKAATEYANIALDYYANASDVKADAQEDYDAAVAVLDDKKDEDGNVTEEGLRTKIANSEKDTAGETLTNLEAYATFEDYLAAVLGYNYEEVLTAEAEKMLNEQIRVYAVAKALVENGALNGYEVVIDDEGTTVVVEGYKAAIENEQRAATFKALIEHSIKHNDEDIKDGKLKRETEKSWKDLLESTDEVFVTNKVFRQYKNDLGRSSYVYAKEQYGENNLRMYLQFENLLSYLLFTDYQLNDYAAHDGEYTVLEKEDGKLAYLFITYEFKPEDAE